MHKLNNENIKDIYRLSPMQEGMYYQYLFDKSSLAYFDQIRFQFHEYLDIDVVKMSLKEIFKRYDILRTVFNHEKLDFPLQVVLKECGIEVHYEDIKAMDRDGKGRYVENYIEQDKKRLFNINEDILMRVAIIEVNKNEYEFIWSFHHIIMDGWCLGIIISDFLEIYNSFIKKCDYKLPVVKQYRKYIDWLEKQDKSISKEYWGNYTKGYNQMTGIPKAGTLKCTSNAYLKDEVKLNFEGEKLQELMRLASENQVTMNTVIQTIWGIILSRYNATNDVMFGAVVSGRPPEIDNIESMVGLFINTIPVRIMYDCNDRFIDILRKVQGEAAKNKNHHYYPLFKIQAESHLKQNLIDHIMVFENYPTEELIQRNINNQNGIDNSRITNPQVFEQTNYDFNIIVTVKNGLSISFQYNANVYEKQLMQNVSKQFLTLINQILANSNICVGELSILSNEEKDTIMNNFNDTFCDYPRNKKIHELLYEQAEENPNNIAMVFDHRELTYRELNERSNQLARYLREKGVSSDVIVGIMVERSFEMIIGIMAILKAGGAYLPISSEYPHNRIKYILNDSAAKVLLVQEKFKNTVDFQGETINLDAEDVYKYDCSNLENVNVEKDLAYVMYTSGSTGNPKGVMIEHTSVINYINWMQKKYVLTKDDVILQKTTFTFDVSVYELFWWMFAGSKVCILVPEGEKDPAEIIKAIEENNVTVMNLVPSMLSIFLDYVETNEQENTITSLKKVLAGGEALTVNHVKKFDKILYKTNHTKLYNVYGPTEATVNSTYFDCPQESEISTIPIGKPIDNMRIYILDKEGRLQPKGIPGEICIAGIGVGRGYLNKPELTMEKFKEDPFVPGERMYKTGDLGEWSTDGNIEYLGRLDNQVKIRGFRIELEEIEKVLSSYEDIKSALVCVEKEENGTGTLIAYIVTDNELSTTILRDYLITKLPEYMIPSYYIKIDKLPVTLNGKLDRNFIKEEGKKLRPDTTYIDPKTDNEKVVAEIWKEVLKIQEVGLKDNFFDLGGTSLDVITVISKINKKFSKKATIVEMFTYPTVDSFCEFLFNDNESNEIKIMNADLDNAKKKMKGNIAKMRNQKK